MLKLKKPDFSRSSFRVPGFPVCETVVLAVMMFTGIKGLLVSSASFLVLGPVWANIWLFGLILLPIVIAFGMIIPTPEGLLASMTGYLGIGLGAICVYAGLVGVYADPFFMGSTTLFIFFIVSFFRFWQLYFQMGRIAKKLENINGGA